ncbi:Histidine kinase-, DNA gyrase B-, and HSP90-like ATPase [Marininema mesophilum]|uniref:histidine kinase n=1 Tax=Marininema mesophilum TaxID=1048340 RepID=A0A1H2RZR3_9BACL|nr:GAF domain-containing sensor histidine kinase [Marininema mesophilum]SDW24797.1 Histidine kinase-, DNA gyrase B-, and HSP90-like ATPase [Marininema mesophilum]
MNREYWLERMCRWSVVFTAWFLSSYSLINSWEKSEWTLLHLLALAMLILVIECFPVPGHDGRVSVHFPVLFTLGTMFSAGISGFVYIVIVMVVTAVRGHSLSRAAFRTGYTIFGLFMVQIYLDTFEQELMASGVWLSALILLGCVIVYEGTSKGIRDGLEMLRSRPRVHRLWVKNKVLETGIAIFCWAYICTYYGMLHDGRETAPLAFLFFFSPLAAFSILTHVISKLIRKKKKLEFLFLITRELNRSLDLTRVMKQTILPLSKVVRYNFGAVYLLQNDRLRPFVTAGEFPEELRGRTLPLNRGISGWTASHARPALVHQARLDPRCQQDREDFEGVRSLLSVPLEMDGEVLGVITLGRTEGDSFEEADRSFLQVLSCQSVVTIRNIRLGEERERRSVAEERNRLAREIHDGIAQSFAGVLMKVESSIKAFDSHPDKVKVWLGESQVKLREGLKEVRYSITALRPSPAQKIGLAPALNRRVEAFCNETGSDGFFETVGDQVPLQSDAEETIYMVCHEALSNAAKHAQADEVKVTLVFASDEVRLVVQDNGVGFSLAKAVYKAEAQKRYGIVGMNERAQSLNASLQFDSEEGDGTTVTLTIPIGEKEEVAVHAY